MKKRTRLIIYLACLVVIGVLYAAVAASQRGQMDDSGGGECTAFGAKLTWQTISLEKFTNFWATKNGIDKEYCLKNGGTWGAWSKTWLSCYCAMPTPDARKSCNNSRECLSGQCLYDTTTQTGQCAEFKMQYLTPNCELDTVKDGKLVKATCLK